MVGMRVHLPSFLESRQDRRKAWCSDSHTLREAGYLPPLLFSLAHQDCITHGAQGWRLTPTRNVKTINNISIKTSVRFQKKGEKKGRKRKRKKRLIYLKLSCSHTLLVCFSFRAAAIYYQPLGSVKSPGKHKDAYKGSLCPLSCAAQTEPPTQDTCLI